MAGSLKRLPDDFQDSDKGGTYWRYMALSKADWADAFADLYRQCFGERTDAETILRDAERRTELLKNYRNSGK